MGETAVAIGIAAMVAAAAVSATAAVQQGRNARELAKSEAKQMQEKGKTEFSLAQRRAMEQRRQGDILGSAVLARSSAFGGGGADPETLNIIGDIAGRSEQNALSELYSGKTASNSLLYGSNVTEIQGRNARSAANLQATSTVLKSAGSMASMYGGGWGSSGGQTPSPDSTSLNPYGFNVNPSYG